MAIINYTRERNMEIYNIFWENIAFWIKNVLLLLKKNACISEYVNKYVKLSQILQQFSKDFAINEAIDATLNLANQGYILLNEWLFQNKTKKRIFCKFNNIFKKWVKWVLGKQNIWLNDKNWEWKCGSKLEFVWFFYSRSFLHKSIGFIKLINVDEKSTVLKVKKWIVN